MNTLKVITSTLTLLIITFIYHLIGLNQSISDARDYLQRHQREDGSFMAFDDPRFKVWETANIAYALSLDSTTNSSMLKKSIQYLKKVRKPDQGYSYRECKSCKKNCIETSSVVFVTLKRQNALPETENTYLSSRLPEDGKWLLEYLKDDEPYFPSATGYGVVSVVLTQKESAQINKSVKQSISYLKETQSEGGDWGVSDGYYGSYFYTIYAVLWALSETNQQNTEMFKKAISYTLNAQDDDGYFHGEDPITLSKVEVSKELHTALALNTLLLRPKMAHWPAILKGLYWLLDKQREDGGWNGGLYPHKDTKREDLYATARSLVTLYSLKSFFF